MSRSFLALVTAAAALVLTAAACGTEGNTPSCPELPLYDIRNEDGGIPSERREAVIPGCVTGPGDATSGTTD